MANEAARFRQDLGPALELWVAEELITPAHAAAIRAYYRMDEAPKQAARAFAVTLRGGVGAMAGLGLLALGAANWDGLPADWRLGLAIAVLVTSTLVGIVLLGQRERAAWGRVAMVVASFALAAAAATLAQRFQIGGDGGEVWGLWALGTLAMAWASVVPGVAIVSACALLGFVFTAPTEWLWLAPWGFAAGILPLAYRCDMRPLLYVGLGGTILTLLAITETAAEAYLVAFAAAAGLLGWQAWHMQRLPYQSVARALIRRDPGDALFALTEAEWIRKGAAVGFVLFALLATLDGGELDMLVRVDQLAAPVGLTLAAFVVGGFVAWGWAIRHAAAPVAHRAVGWSALAASAALIAVPGTGWVAAACSVAAVVASLAIAHDGLRTADASWFWTGVLGGAWSVVTLFVMSAEGEPLIAGLGLVAGAAIVAAAARWLDRQAAQNRPAHAAGGGGAG